MYALVVVIGIAVLFGLEGGVSSIRGLWIVAGIVIGAGCLIYARASILKSLIYAALVCSLCYFADRMKEREIIGVIVLAAAVWIVHSVEQAWSGIVKRIDGLEAKLDAIESKANEM